MTPPPLKPQADAPARPQQPPRALMPPKGCGNSNRTWLIVGCSLAGLLLVAAVLLFFLTDLFSSDAEDYDDGATHEKALTIDDGTERPLQEMPLTEQSADTLAAATGQAEQLHGLGSNGYGSFSLDIHISPSGEVTGTYWNIFGNLKFTVQGHRQSDGTLDMELTCTDGVKTHMTLYSSDGYNYSGQWGKKRQPVNATLYNGPVPQVAYNTILSGHIKGGVLNQDFCISEYNGKAYYWYPSQGFASRLPVEPASDGFTLYNTDGTNVGTFRMDSPGSGTLTMMDGQTFSITIN